jgi:sortase A
MKPLRFFEIAAWTGGVLLLGSYAGARYWYADARDDGVASFNAARDEHLRARAADVPPADSNHAPRASDPVDMSTWSPTRVEEYRQALKDTRTPDAVLRIPAVKLVVPVFEGTSDQNLNRGAGRIEGTARIGEPGNIGIAAHRDGFFRVLKDVRVGDTLVLDQVATTETYRVVATRIVEPSDVSVLQSTSTPSVTLVTCFPFYYVGSAPRRFIVHAQIAAPGEALKTSGGEAASAPQGQQQ